MNLAKGFTLIELMIAVAILAIIAAIAIPAYNGYIRESRLGAMRMNLDALRIAVEAHRLDDPASSYVNSTVALPYNTNTALSAAYGWVPEGDSDAYAYTVIPTSTTYSLQATLVSGGVPWVACDRDPTKSPVFKCCDGKTGTAPSACPRP